MKWFAATMQKWFSIRKQTEPRPAPAAIPPIEPLENRLCLGSMHWAGPGQWADQQAEAASGEHALRPRQALLVNALEERQTEYADIEAKDNGQSHGRTTTSEQVATTESVSRSVPSQTQVELGTLAGAAAEEARPARSEAPLNKAIANFKDNTPLAIVSNHSSTPTSVEPESSPNLETRDSELTVPQSRHTNTATSTWNESALNRLGLTLDENGDAIGLAESLISRRSGFKAWWTSASDPVVIKYDFRDQGQFVNQITDQQKALAADALQRWSEAAGGKIQFQHDTQASARQIINIGVGDLEALGHVSGAGSVLGLGGGVVSINDSGQLTAGGVAWLDQAEHWDNTRGNGNPEGTFDFSTVVTHEIGHSLGYADSATPDHGDAMSGTYTGERNDEAVDRAVERGDFYRTVERAAAAHNHYDVLPMTTGDVQLSEANVKHLLKRASVATASNDGIIAVVDRNGRILGVRVEADVLATITDPDTLVFAIDGAVAKARTAALFSNGDPENGTLAPLTSRTVRFLSQTTIAQREVESNPNVDGTSAATAAASTTRGPGFVAPIGVGGHFPPDIEFTPLVDLFGIEHTNRDSTTAPGADGIRGTGDDILLSGRFNIDPSHVPTGHGLFAPESYGAAQNSGKLLSAQSRGIATLPGGIPIFRDTPDKHGVKDGVGDTLVGGIGVFFPGPDGFATHEQGFVPSIGQTTAERVNASRVLEAEYIAYAAVGGSLAAQEVFGIPGAKIGTINGVAPVEDIDLPFGRLDLVGITLEVAGPVAGKWGVHQLVEFGDSLGVGSNSGADQSVDVGGDLYRDGLAVPEGWLVTPHDGVNFTAAQVEEIINRGIAAANEVRAAVRLPLNSQTRMVFAVTDVNGEVLGLYRMKDATTFSIDVAVAKARNVSYYADALALQPEDQVVDQGTAFTNRTFRFLAQPRFPSGIDGTPPPAFSILNDDSIDPLTGENIGAPAPVSAFDSVLGHDAFFPMTNFRDPDNLENQNGIVFFPGSAPLYHDGKLIGGLGVSGDGVDQDDVVTFFASLGFNADGVAPRADQTFVDGVRLPYQKFLRNPFGGIS